RQTWAVKVVEPSSSMAAAEDTRRGIPGHRGCQPIRATRAAYTATRSPRLIQAAQTRNITRYPVAWATRPRVPLPAARPAVKQAPKVDSAVARWRSLTERTTNTPSAG